MDVNKRHSGTAISFLYIGSEIIDWKSSNKFDRDCSFEGQLKTVSISTFQRFQNTVFLLEATQPNSSSSNNLLQAASGIDLNGRNPSTFVDEWSGFRFKFEMESVVPVVHPLRIPYGGSNSIGSCPKKWSHQNLGSKVWWHRKCDPSKKVT